jgi:small GTP-binding protein
MLRLPMQGRSERRLVMLGLESAGKSSILQRLAPAGVEQSPGSTQSVAFGVEVVAHRGRSFSIWDVGFAGRDKIRPLLMPFYKGACGVIFVVDSCRAESVAQARGELEKLLEVEDVREAPLLVFANKQDLPGSLSASQVSETLALDGLRRPWLVQPCCAQTGSGASMSRAVFARSPCSQPQLLDDTPKAEGSHHAIPSPVRSRRTPSTPQQRLSGFLLSPKGSGRSYSGLPG